MENLYECYSTVKNWTRTSHKNVDKFYEALGVEQEEDDTNKKLAINFFAGQWTWNFSWKLKASTGNFCRTVRASDITVTWCVCQNVTCFLLKIG